MTTCSTAESWCSRETASASRSSEVAAMDTCRFRVANRDGSDQRVLVDMRSDAFDPEWAPDGRRLVFASLDRGNWDVYVIDEDSRRIRQVTSHGADGSVSVVLARRAVDIFSSNRTGRYEVYRLPAEAHRDDDAVQVTRGGGLAGVESFDGRYLVYELNQNGNPAMASDTPLLESRSGWPAMNRPRCSTRGGPATDKGWRLTRKRDLLSHQSPQFHRPLSRFQERPS